MIPSLRPHRLHSRPGVMALVLVIIVGVIGLLVSFSAATRGIGEVDNGLAEIQSRKAFALADACIEDTLLHYAQGPSNPSGTLTLGEGSCTISASVAGQVRNVTVVATVDRYTQRVFVSINLATTPITVTQWKLLDY